MNRIKLICCLFSLVTSLHSQTLAKLRVGDDDSKLTILNAPSATDKYRSYLLQKWVWSNGNELSVTTGSGKILYLEADWGGRSDETGCDLSGIRFGVTTLTDIRRRFGSNGFEFKQRGGVLQVADGVVLLNSYEVNGTIVTFTTKVMSGQGEIADRAKLDGVSIATAEYAKSEWGDRIYDPAYKKVEWK